MKKGNIVLLAAGYLAGLAIALKFNKKSPEVINEEMNTDNKYKNLGKNIMEIHKNLFETAETAIFSEENKKRVEEYRQRFTKELDAFKSDAEVQLESWKAKGMDKKDEIEVQLRDLYNRRVELMGQAKEKGIGLLEDAKSEGIDLLHEGKKMANKVYDDSKKNLDKMYADLKKKIEK